MQKFVVSENEDDIIQKKSDDFMMSQNSNEFSSNWFKNTEKILK